MATNRKMKSWIRALKAPWELARKGAYLGQDTRNGRHCYFPLKGFSTGLHLLGPPGGGKTRMLRWLFQLFTQVPNASVILLNVKGSLADDALRWGIGAGLAKRIIHFPGGNGRVIGFNPLQTNGASSMLVAKMAQEAIISAGGEGASDRERMPQLARCSLAALAAVSEQGLTLTEAAHLLMPESEIRPILIPRLKNRQLQRSLLYIDSLQGKQQNDLVQSSLARMERFLIDESLRHIVTQQVHALDLSQVLEEGKILIADFQLYRPFRLDDARMMSRLLVNALVAHVFGRAPDKRTPVFLIADEFQNFVSEDLALALDLGREIGLNMVLSHQRLSQLVEEDPSGRVLHAVLGSCRSRMIFGGSPPEDLDIVMRDAAFCQIDPMKVKDVLTTLELDPQETQRIIHTRASSESDTIADGLTLSEGEVESHARARSRGTGMGCMEGVGTGQTVLPDGQVVISTHEQAATNEFTVESESEIEGNSIIKSRAVLKSRVSGRTYGESQSVVPFIEYLKSRVVSSRQFQPLEEQLHEWARQVKGQEQAHFLFKGPNAKSPPRFLQAPWVEDPIVSDERFRKGMEEILGQSCYSTPREIELEEEKRTQRLLTGQVEDDPEATLEDVLRTGFEDEEKEVK